MTPEQIKTMFEYLSSIQSNVDRVLEENESADKELKKQYQDLYMSVGNLTAEFHLVLQELKEIKKSFAKESENIVEQVVGGLDHVEQTLKTKTVHIVRKGFTFKGFFAKFKLWGHNQDI